MIAYLQVENISKSFGERTLFSDISFGIGKGDKVAMIAKNGTGKSTLMKIIDGIDKADSGDVIFRNDISIAYLDQNPVLDDQNTIFTEVFNSKSPKLEVIKEYENAVAHNDNDKIIEFSAKMDNLNAWDYESSVHQILSKLQITDFDKKIKELSGGQRKRVGLAKILIESPDFLMLDEPTNHLDMEMTEWLEEYLGTANCTLLMVTHDRYFLDNVCSRIIEMDNGKIYSYDGNYSYYLQKRAERLETENAELAKARNLFRTEQEWMRRMPQARSHKAQYRIDNFQKLKEKVSNVRKEDELNIEIQGKRLGKKILELHHVSKYFDGKCFLKDFSYKFVRGERIGIIGKNGVGKSTFLNIITGGISPDSGSIDVGETVSYGYYRQMGITFNPEDRVIDAVKKIAESIDMGDGRDMTASQFLEYFLFDSKQQYSLISKLSGGEKRRLYLLTVLIGNPNFLILDEPTNDLDIVTLNVLEEYLKRFSGCLLIVSHDRFFTDKVTDRVFAFEGDGVVKDFPGNYTQYKNKKEEEEEEQKLLKSVQKTEKRPEVDTERNANRRVKMTFAEKKEFEKLDKEISDLNTEKAEIENLLSSGQLKAEDIVEKSQRLGEINKDLDVKEMRWLELSEIGS